MSWLDYAMGVQRRLDAGEDVPAIEQSIAETIERTAAKVLNDKTEPQMDTNEAIAEKVEKASVGSAALDELVWRAIGGKRSHTPPPFTTSMDGARQAVPRPSGSMSVATTFAVGGFQDDRPHGAWAKVWHDCSMAGSPPDPCYEAKAASPALALCAAGLRAYFAAGGRFECLA